MYEDLFPVSRSGSVLRPRNDIGFSTEQTIIAGRELYRRARPITQQFALDIAKTIADSSDIRMLNHKIGNNSSRIRFTPNVIVDFHPVTFSVRPYNYEARSVVTVCPGNNRGKLWVRVSLTNFMQNDADKSAISHNLRNWSTMFRDLWIQYYNEFCGSTGSITGQKVQFDNKYKIDIFMISALSRNNPLLETFKEIDMPDQERGLDRDKVFALLNSELLSRSSVQLSSDSDDDALKRLAAYRFPSFDLETEASYDIIGDAATDLDTDFRALCAVFIRRAGSEVVGIALSPKRPSTFRKSASHVASAEISFELGRIF